MSDYTYDELAEIAYEIQTRLNQNYRKKLNIQNDTANYHMVDPVGYGKNINRNDVVTVFIIDDSELRKITSRYIDKIRSEYLKKKIHIDLETMYDLEICGKRVQVKS